MSNLHNLQRDQFHLENLKTVTNQSYSTGVAMSRNINASADPTVYQDATQAQNLSNSISVTAGQWRAAGCYVKQPAVEKTPYRVKAYANPKDETFVVVGISQAQTGTDDAVTNVVAFPFQGTFDEVFLITDLPSNNSDFGKPLFFGIAQAGGSTKGDMTISIQNMSIASPTYTSTTS